MTRFRSSVTATCASAFVALSSFAQCVPSFLTPPTVPAGPEPRVLVVANLNRDAYPDLVVGNFDEQRNPIGGLTILIGQPDGRAQLTELLYDQEQVVDVVAGDFDGDGDDDIAFVRVDHLPILRVLRNDGGTFVESFSFLASAVDLETGDFNGDSFVDLVSVSTSSAVVYRRKGDGTYDVRTFATGLTLPPVAIDLDGDGKDELLSGTKGSTSSTIEIFSDDAATGLAKSRTIPASGSRDELAAGDFDGDGTVDVIALSESFGPVDFIYHAAAATQVTKKIFLDLFPEDRPAVGDIDQDGFDDLAFDSIGLVVAFGRADQTLGRRTEFWVAGRNDVAFGGRDLALADLDRDGDLDAAMTEQQGVAVIVNRNGALHSAPFGGYAVAAGDFNGDGRTDLFDGAEIILAAPDGSITAPDGGSSAVFAPWAATADFNRDGSLDAVLYDDSFDGGFLVRLGDGAGGLGSAMRFTFGSFADGQLLADFNHDGLPDLAQMSGSGEAGLLIALGKGDGTFQRGPTVALPLFTAAIATGDFNGDGYVDLAVTRNVVSESVAVLFNDQSGNFGTPVLIGNPGGDRIEVGDLNGDGRDDIVAAAFHILHIYLSQGQTFTGPVEYDAGTETVAQLFLRDFNADRRLDILAIETATTASKNVMALRLGDGQGGFGEIRLLRAASDGYGLIGDFDGDGHLDLYDSGFVRFGSCGLERRRAARH